MGDYPTTYDVVDKIEASNFATRVLSYKPDNFTPKSYTLSELNESLVSSSFIIESIQFIDIDANAPLFDHDQYEEHGYCRRTMECLLSGERIPLNTPSSLSYRDVPFFLIERDNYLVTLDRYAGKYSLQLVGMGRY